MLRIACAKERYRIFLCILVEVVIYAIKHVKFRKAEMLLTQLIRIKQKQILKTLNITLILCYWGRLEVVVMTNFAEL